MDNPQSKTSTIVISALAVIACAGFVMRFGFSVETLQYMVLVALLAWASFEDLRSRTIPNLCIAAAIGVRVACFVAFAALGRFSASECVYYIVSGIAMGVMLVAFALAFERVTGRESMGGGDIKLYALAGLYLGFEKALLVVFLSCVFALVASAITACGSHGERGLSRQLPFGPAIAVAFVISAIAV